MSCDGAKLPKAALWEDEVVLICQIDRTTVLGWLLGVELYNLARTRLQLVVYKTLYTIMAQFFDGLQFLYKLL
jgi:hypothetical protein